jgi:hypothetical protein
VSTVKTQIINLYRKLGVRNAPQAVMVAAERGFFGPVSSEDRIECHRLLDELLDQMFGDHHEGLPPCEAEAS